MSGGPVAGRTNAARVTIATGIAIRIAQKKQARLQPQPAARAKQAMARSTSVMAADGAIATRTSASRVPMHRPTPQRSHRQMARRLKSRAMTRAGYRANVFRVRDGTRKNSKGNLKENFKASRRVNAKDGRATARRIDNMPAARRRGNASVR